MAEEEDPDTIVQNVGVSQRVQDELLSHALQAFKEFHLLFCHHLGFSRTCRDRGVCKVLHFRYTSADGRKRKPSAMLSGRHAMSGSGRSQSALHSALFIERL